MRKKRLKWAVVVILLLLCLFMSITVADYDRYCPHCNTYCRVAKVKIFGLLIYEKSDIAEKTPTLFYRVSDDLGQPCDHAKMTEHKVYCRLCNIIPVYRASEIGHYGDFDASWYDDEISARVVRYSQENPSLASEFYERVIEHYDGTYHREFLTEIRNESVPRYVTKAHVLSDQEQRELVELLKEIEWIDLWQSGYFVQRDPAAKLLIAVGRPLAPMIAEEITNTEKSKWLSWGTVGDNAHYILSVIYVTDYPMSKFLSAKDGDYENIRHYRELHRHFLSSGNPETDKQNREKLKTLWKDYIEWSEDFDHDN